MQIEIKVPQVGESITEVTIASWHFQVGDVIKIGDILVELETDKVTVEIPAPENGILEEIKFSDGQNVQVGNVLALMKKAEDEAVAAPEKELEKKDHSPQKVSTENDTSINKRLAPAATRIVKEYNIDLEQIEGSGKRKQITKSDLLDFMDQPAKTLKSSANQKTSLSSKQNIEREKIVPLSRLRKRIAEHLVQVQNTAAILTTFNEINMQKTMDLRKKYKTSFMETHGVNLGFMSFFIKASVYALKKIPSVNSEISGSNLILKNYYDISVAIGGPKGLVVPVIRDADKKDFAEIEMEISHLIQKVKENKIELHELEGGTFTISNGGTYGSMMSTPILNAPQTGILGMHNIVKRAVVINDKLAIRPIMFIALSYDHRVIDGKEAVTFLVKIKEAIENPEIMLFNI